MTKDKRTSSWPMMESPMPSTLICLAYLVFVLAFPRYMKHREAFNLQPLNVAYNFFMIILSGYLFYEFLVSGWLFDYSFSCQTVDYSNSPKALRVSINILITIFILLSLNISDLLHSNRWLMFAGSSIYPSLSSC